MSKVWTRDKNINFVRDVEEKHTQHFKFFFYQDEKINKYESLQG